MIDFFLVAWSSPDCFLLGQTGHEASSIVLDPAAIMAGPAADNSLSGLENINL